MKLGKRLLALLLALTMVLSNLPVSVLAEEFEDFAAETVVEETQEILEETTQAPTEAPETEEPTEAPTEAPEETGAVQETPSPEPTAAVETEPEETLPALAEASEEAMDADTQPYLSVRFLRDDGNGWYENEYDELYDFIELPYGGEYFVIFYRNEWNADKGVYESVGPVSVTTPDTTYLELDQDLTGIGAHGAFFYRVKATAYSADQVQIENPGADGAPSAYIDIRIGEPEPYLSFGMLQETEDGYVEPDTNHRDGWQFRIMPSEHYMLQFFLNTWDGDQYVQEPVPMVSTSNITYTPIEGGEYFYDVSVSHWDTELKLVTILDDGTQIGGITIHTNRNEVGWYSSASMSNSTWLWEYEYDPDKELSLYVGTDNTYDETYRPDGAPVIGNVPEGYVTLEEVNPQETYDKVYKVSLSDEAIAELTAGGELHLEVRWNGWWSHGEYMEKTFWLPIRMNPDKVVRQPSLSFHWLEWDEEGRIYEDMSRSEDQFRIRPDRQHGHVYYLNVWNAQTGEYDSWPVEVQVDGNDISVEKITDNIAPNQTNSSYFYRITGLGWGNYDTIYTVYDGQKIGLPVWTDLGETSIHTDPSCTTDNYVNDYQVDPNGENELYFRFESDYWEMTGVNFEDPDAGIIGDSNGDGIYEMILSDSLIQSVMNQGRYVNLQVHVRHQEEDGRIYTEIFNEGFDCWYEGHETYLSFGWLENWGEGWFENEYHDDRGEMSVRVGQNFYLIHYLNVWNGEGYDSWPVHVRSGDSRTQLTSAADEAAPGQDNAEYFYRMTTSAWGHDAEIYCEYEGQRYAYIAGSNLGNQSTHSSESCTTEDYIPDLEVKSGQTNAFYLRFDDSFWDLTNVRLNYPHEGRVSKKSDTCYKITLEDWVAEDISQNGPRGIEYVLELQAKDDPDHQEEWHNSIHTYSTDPFLSFGWLENHGNGWFETEWHEQRNFNIRPGDEFYHIYYLNTYDKATGTWAAEPVSGFWYDNDYILVEKLNPDEIQEGQDNADCFMKITAVSWNEDTSIYLEDEDGNQIHLPVGTHLGESSFHSDPSCTTDNFVNNVALDPFGESVVYYRFESDYWKADSIEVDEKDAKVTKVRDGVWKLTLTDTFVAGAMYGSELQVHPVVVAKDDPNHTEPNWMDSIWCNWNAGECLAMLGINGDTYEIFEGGKILHHYPTGNMNENLEREWAMETVDSLPEGVAYNLKTNTLTLKNAELTHLNMSYQWFDEWSGEGGKNLPNGDLTIDLVGENSIINDEDCAIHFFGDLNVTFTGKGSLYIKATNSPDMEDRWGNAFSFHALQMDGGSLTFSESVKVTAEIAGQGMCDRWDEDENYEGRFLESLAALQLNGTAVTIEGKASLTTVLPEGATYNGPKTDGGRLEGNNHYEGGYYGMRDFASLTVESGTLNTQNLPIQENGSYTQTGGTVNIEGLGAIFTNEDWDEEGDPYDWDHYHYYGIRADGPADITISGGKLNMDMEPTREEYEVSSYFHGFETNGGTLTISGGEININGKFNGNVFQINEETVVTVSGGTINASGAVTDESDRDQVVENAINFMDLTPASKAYFLGGTINTDWASLYMGGEVVFDGTKLNGYGTILNADNRFEMKSGTISLDSGAVCVRGEMEMTGGKWDLPRTFIEIDNGFIFSGGEIEIDYDGTNYHDYEYGDRYPAMSIRSSFEMGEDAELTIVNKADAPAIEIGAFSWFDEESGESGFGAGHLFVTGGTLDVTHSGTDRYPGIVFWTEEDFAEDVGYAVCVADGGVLNLSGPKNAFVGDLLLGNGPRQMYVGEGGKVNVSNGQVWVGPGSVLTIDGGTFDLDTGVAAREADEWYIGLIADWSGTVEVCSGTLNVAAENIDCAMDVNGTYIQTGGTVNVKAYGDQGEQIAMVAKNDFILEDGVLNVTGLTSVGATMELGYTLEERAEDGVLVMSGGTLNLNANNVGIFLKSPLTIDGGDVNIELKGLKDKENKMFIGFGIRALGITDFDEEGRSYTHTPELTINDGNFTVSMPAAPKGYRSVGGGIMGLNADVYINGGNLTFRNTDSIFTQCLEGYAGLVLDEDMAVYSMSGGTLMKVLEYEPFEIEDIIAGVQDMYTYYYMGFEEDNEAGDILTDEGVDYVLNTVITSNACGEDLSWELSGNVLKILGDGAIPDYSAANPAPWAGLSSFITRAEIGEDVSGIGSYAFNGLKGLKRITFLGEAPDFADNAFAGVKAEAGYPSQKDSWTADVRQNYGGKITWEPYYIYPGDLTATLKEITEDLEKPIADGLQVGDSVQIIVTAEDGTVIPAEELTFSITSGAKYATVTEEGIVIADVAKKTVKVKAVLTGDPAKRSATVTLKTAETTPDKLYLEPNSEQMGEMQDAFIYTDGFVEEAEGVWHLYVNSGAKKTFTMKALGSLGDVLTDMSVTGTVTWATSNRAIAAVKEASDGTVTVTINKNMEGTCTITGTSKLNKDAAVTLKITVADFAPKLGTKTKNTITLNTYKSNDGVTLALTCHEDDLIAGDPEVLVYDKETKSYVSSDVFEAAYADGQVTISAVEETTAGGKAMLVVKTEHTEHEIPFTIKISNKMPSVTIKQTRKVNLKDENSYGLLKVTAKNAEVADIELEGGSFNLVLDEQGNSLRDEEGNFYIEHDGFEDTAVKTDVTVILEGYERTYTKKNHKISTEKKDNKPVLGETTLTMYRDLPGMTASTTLSTYYVGVDVDDFELTSGGLTVVCEDGVLTVSGIPAKTTKIKLNPEVDGEPVQKKAITLTVKVADKPKVKLTSTKYKMSLSDKTLGWGEDVVAPAAGGYPLTFKEIEDGTYAYADEFDVIHNKETGAILVFMTDACTTTGKRSIKLTPMYGDVAVAPITLSVSVSK